MKRERVRVRDQIFLIPDQCYPQQQHIRARGSSVLAAVSHIRSLNRCFRCQPACADANIVFATALTGGHVLVDVELRSTSALFEPNAIPRNRSLFRTTEKTGTISWPVILSLLALLVWRHECDTGYGVQEWRSYRSRSLLVEP